MAAEMVRRNFFLPNELHDKAATLARRKGVKTADIVRTALEKYLQAVERAEKLAKEHSSGGT
jgi:predicted DNA-binding protein